jgi:hypothetical protein
MKYLLVYGFDFISPKKRLEFNRKLYGFSDSSNFGSYSYFRKGVLNPNECERLAKGVVLCKSKPKNLIKHLKEFKARYRILKVLA